MCAMPITLSSPAVSARRFLHERPPFSRRFFRNSFVNPVAVMYYENRHKCEFHRIKGACMAPEIIDRDEVIVVGIRAVLDNAALNTGTLWKDKFLPRQHEIKSADRKYYAVFNALPNTDAECGRYEYVAGVVTNSLENIPVGMVGWVIPAGKFAETEAIGLTGIHQACRELIADWLPDSGYEMMQSPMFAYTSEMHPDGEQAVWKINVPIETPEILAELEQWLKSSEE